MTEKKLYGTVLVKSDVILEYVYGSDEPQGLANISENTGLTKSTTLKILDTLEHIGYVIKNKKDRTYSIGFKLMKYSSKEMSQIDLAAKLNQYLEDLHKKFDETVHLGVFKNNHIFTINKFQSSRPVVCSSSAIGETKELYSSGMGKAVLAELDDNTLLNYINSNEFIPKTEKTIAGTQRLLAELEETRKTGYSVDNEENEEGVYCLGAAITNTTDSGEKTVLGAFSISIPSFRATDDVLKQLVDAVLETKEIANASFNK
ncbi:IclR family transcriptional regulator [Jeotgalibaca sp. MA1X17-3]|uniref:IclR family transcriptional regulator n=1 Tax=Jeotgalibaca sp. MA1X17-3 TaxID=2908211 RepID=UPI001F2F6C8E|nr:IclR family transcriptional regulator [Jeotgalibaca sp. MA1X17-3]UJF16134.1 IclR family transcriptional regulator [Jeotgalibaca sp. MA1X17-3]